MISYLRGALHTLDVSEVVLDVQGVGYGVRVPVSTFYELEEHGSGATVELLIHTQVREDALELYGFLTAQEKGLFERLISVSGIGPKLALSILSGMAPNDLVGALASKDVGKLVRIPGVGKKTAERLVLELKDRAREMVDTAGTDVVVERGLMEDLAEALVGLGYREREAEKAAREVVRTSGSENSELGLAEGLRQALRKLSRA